MRFGPGAPLGVLLALAAGGAVEARPLRVMALDQCADQYALALRPDADLALSPRADDPDAWLRREAAGRPRVRPTLEAAVAFRPDVVVRYWGGEPRLLSRLESGGTRVATITDATDFNGVRANIRSVAEVLEAREAGEALIARMDSRLGTPAGADSVRPSALYLTPGGFTAGKGTLVDAILTAAGFRNAADRPFFSPVSVERVALFPPVRFVLGFFDQARGDWRGPGRHPVVQRATVGRVAARLPAAALTCPGWFAADAAAMLRDAPK
ncbi:ABC transporter substrate-binding protein [Brevundimonas lenta]|uniref:Iron complex transport system substrate-binding protein n=1 Tax=Brevundimonas lenta TaxID=424796 RepID=A0A7W6NQA9_9CAUL|nr:ABC transporter substrate-binding protein [Brevundimonas lenta]MBB4083012.1 iron complex transport system substrate-binding protein [Brevundimonas lenta]